MSSARPGVHVRESAQWERQHGVSVAPIESSRVFLW
jgi:hypothetical protein